MHLPSSRGPDGEELVRLGPEHVGRRVVVRHRLPDGSATDVLGTLESWGTRVRVRRGEGGAGEPVTELAATDVLAAKPVPPRRARPGHLGVLALEDVTADSWVPPETARVGRWLLRAGQGHTGRANSALALGSPGLPLEDAVAGVERWYGARGLPARFAVPRPLAGVPEDRVPGERALADVAALDALLDARGWTASPSTLVLTAPTRVLRDTLAAWAAQEGRTEAPPVALGEVPDDAWLRRAYGDPGGVPDVVRSLLVSSPAQVFAAVPPETAREPRAAAVGRAAGSRGWAVVTGLAVAPELRRRGLARAVLASLVDWATQQRLPHVALQVLADNVPALALYERLGMVRHHVYVYRQAPAKD